MAVAQHGEGIKIWVRVGAFEGGASEQHFYIVIINITRHGGPCDAQDVWIIPVWVNAESAHFNHGAFEGF